MSEPKLCVMCHLPTDAAAELCPDCEYELAREAELERWVAEAWARDRQEEAEGVPDDWDSR